MRRPRTLTLTAAGAVLAVAAALAPTQSAIAGSMLGDPKGASDAAGTSNDATYDVRRGAARQRT
jgi:hypothetical protein